MLLFSYNVHFNVFYKFAHNIYLNQLITNLYEKVLKTSESNTYKCLISYSGQNAVTAKAKKTVYAYFSGEQLLHFALPSRSILCFGMSVDSGASIMWGISRSLSDPYWAAPQGRMRSLSVGYGGPTLSRCWASVETLAQQRDSVGLTPRPDSDPPCQDKQCDVLLFGLVSLRWLSISRCFRWLAGCY